MRSNAPQAQVYFKSTPVVMPFPRDPLELRQRLVRLATREGNFYFEAHFEASPRHKMLLARAGGLCAHWEPDNDGVWDFHALRNSPLLVYNDNNNNNNNNSNNNNNNDDNDDDNSEGNNDNNNNANSNDVPQQDAVIVISWKVLYKVHVGRHYVSLPYESTQTFADFERVVRATRLVRERLATAHIFIEAKSESEKRPFTAEVLQQCARSDECLELFVRPRQTKYADLKALHVLHLFDFVPSIDIESLYTQKDYIALPQLFSALTATPQREFSTKVDRWAAIMLRCDANNPFGLLVGFRFLNFIKGIFPHPRDPRIEENWDEPQRRKICNHVLYPLATMLSTTVHEGVEVWPEECELPPEALGNGVLDFFIPASSPIIINKALPRRADDAEKKDEDENNFNDSDQDEEEHQGEYVSNVDKALAQVLAQAFDTMREGSVTMASRKRKAESSSSDHRRFCVLSSGQRYYFFRMDWNGEETSKPLVTFLGFYRFRYFPSRKVFFRPWEVSPNETFTIEDYVKVLAAFAVCVLDGRDSEDLESCLLNTAKSFEAFTLDKATDKMNI